MLNLEGVQTRYENPDEVLEKIVNADKDEITSLMQKIYQEPVQEDLIAARIREIKDSGRSCSGQFHPATSARVWRDRAGSGRGCFRRAMHGLDRAPYFHRI